MELTTPKILQFNYQEIINFVLGLPSETKQDLVAKLQINLQATQKAETEFWKFISLLDWTKENNHAITQPLIKELSKKTVTEIQEFAEVLSEKLAALSTQAHIESSYKNTNNEFSADEFLYICCCVVANGQEFYKSVLQNPDLMPKNIDFESLLYVAEKAYFLKTGKTDFGFKPKTQLLNNL
jgi:hypothetical protein